MQKDPSCLLEKKKKKSIGILFYSALCLQPATTTMKPWGFNFLSWILPGVKARWSQTAEPIPGPGSRCQSLCDTTKGRKEEFQNSSANLNGGKSRCLGVGDLFSRRSPPEFSSLSQAGRMSHSSAKHCAFLRSKQTHSQGKYRRPTCGNGIKTPRGPSTYVTSGRHEEAHGGGRWSFEKCGSLLFPIVLIAAVIKQLKLPLNTFQPVFPVLFSSKRKQPPF